MRFAVGLLRVLLCPGLLSALLVGLFCRGLAAWLGARVGRRPALPLWQPLSDLLHLAGKARLPGAGRLGLVAWPGLLGLVALSWAVGMLPWPRWPWAQDLPGDWIVYLFLLAVPALARLVAAGLSDHPMAALGARRQAPLEIARLLPVMLAGLALPLLTHQDTLSQQASATFPIALISIAVAGVLLATLPRPLWDRDEHDGPLAGIGGRPLAIYRALEALELAAHTGLIAVVLRASSLFPPQWEGGALGVALVAVTVVLAVLEARGRRALLPEAAKVYSRWILPIALLVAVLGWWLGR